MCGDSGVEDEEVYRRRTSITSHNLFLEGGGPDTHSSCDTVVEPTRVHCLTKLLQNRTSDFQVIGNVLIKQDCRLIEDGSSANRIPRHAAFYSCDLDFDPMTLIQELDLDCVNLYLHTKNELSR